MNQKRTLCNAKRHCWIVKNRIHQSPDGKAVDYIDEQESWLSANEDTLPRFFLQNWRDVRKKLNEMNRRMEEIENMPNGQVKARLTEEIRKQRNSCSTLLRATALELRQVINSLN